MPSHVEHVGRRFTVAVVLASVVPGLAHAQCPDGSAPPCRSAAGTAPSPTSVAVLYFDNASPDSTDDYLAEALTDAVIAQLGEVGRISVKSRSAVRRFRGRNVPELPSIGRALGVAYLVTGSAERGDPGVRVTHERARDSTPRRWPAADSRTHCGSTGAGMRQGRLRQTACWIGERRRRTKRCGATRPTPMPGSPGDTCSSSGTPTAGMV